MGYDVHITRADEWLDSDAKPITLEEWTAYVASDPDMRLDGFAETPLRGDGALRYESEGLAVWTAYSGHDKAGNMAWFDHRDSRIVVKKPDEEILQKMRSVANALHARVQGDEGEFYDQPGALESSKNHAGFPGGKREQVRPRRPWWRRLLGR